MEYRGIQLDESVKLYNKDGSYRVRIKRGLDTFIDYMETTKDEITGIYKGYGEPINIKCENGHVYPRIPSNVLTKTKCPACSGNDNKYAREQFYQRVKEWGYTVFEEYVNMKTSLKGLCDKGHEIVIKPNHLRDGKGCCWKCRPTITAIRANEQTKKEFPLLVKENGHRLLSDYIDAKTKVFIDFKCNHEPHSIKPNDYKNGYGCPRCFDEKRGKEALEKAKKKFEETVKTNGHILLSEYKGNHKEVMIDFKCGHKNQTTIPNNYNTGARCRICATIRTHEIQNEKARKDFIALVKSRGHELKSPYIHNKKKVLIDYRCKHGHEPILVRANDYKHSNVFCPRCSESNGEKIIRDWLDENNIEHTKGRISKRIWYYDIIIPSVNLIIEVHGEQHYKEKNLWHIKSGRTLKQQQETDRKKRELAEKLGYNYMEVDYREHKPELALERFLKAFSEFGRNNKSEKQRVGQLSLF